MSQFFVGGSGGGGGSGIETINGDTGSVTGTIVTFTAENAGSTVEFSGTGSTMDLNVTDSNSNVFIGFNSGNNTLTGTQNTGVGASVGSSLTTGLQNTMFGTGAGTNLQAGLGNSLFGNFAGISLIGGANNTLLGLQAANNLVSGNNVICVGRQAGTAYTSNESDNICIGNPGIEGDNGITRIGTTGTHVVTFISGQIVGENGSAASPTYIFEASDTGMYYDGTNIGFSWQGTPKMSIGFNNVFSGNTNQIQNGVVFTGVTTITANYTAQFTEYCICVDTVTAASAVTIQLPTGPILGQLYTIKDSTGSASTYNISISGAVSGETIDDQTSIAIDVDFGSVQLIYMGNQWGVI